MGEKGHVLVVLYLDEPTPLIEQLRANLPDYKVTYFKQKQPMEESLAEGEFLANNGGVPKGEFIVLFSTI